MSLILFVQCESDAGCLELALISSAVFWQLVFRFRHVNVQACRVRRVGQELTQHGSCDDMQDNCCMVYRQPRLSGQIKRSGWIMLRG